MFRVQLGGQGRPVPLELMDSLETQGVLGTRAPLDSSVPRVYQVQLGRQAPLETSDLLDRRDLLVSQDNQVLQDL